MPAPEPESVPAEWAYARSETLKGYWRVWDAMQRARYVAQAETGGFYVVGGYDANSGLLPNFASLPWSAQPGEFSSTMAAPRVVIDAETGLPANLTDTVGNMALPPTGPLAEAMASAGDAVGAALSDAWNGATGAVGDAARQAATMAAVLAALVVAAFIILRR